MMPDIGSIGPFTLHSFGLMVALAFVAAYLVLRRGLAERGLGGDRADDIVVAAALGGVLGSKLNSVIQDGTTLFSSAGLIWYGGLIGGTLAVLGVAGWRRLPLGQVANAVAPALALGYAVGRVGCQLAGDGDYGRPTDLPWGMSYPNGTVPTTDIVHPTPVYESLAMLLAFLVLWRLRHRLSRPWQLFGAWAVLAGLERFLVEFLRRNTDTALGLTTAQLVSVGMMLIGAALLLRRSPKSDPEPNPGAERVSEVDRSEEPGGLGG